MLGGCKTCASSPQPSSPIPYQNPYSYPLLSSSSPPLLLFLKLLSIPVHLSSRPAPLPSSYPFLPYPPAPLSSSSLSSPGPLPSRSPPFQVPLTLPFTSAPLFSHPGLLPYCSSAYTALLAFQLLIRSGTSQLPSHPATLSSSSRPSNSSTLQLTTPGFFSPLALLQLSSFLTQLPS